MASPLHVLVVDDDPVARNRAVGALRGAEGFGEPEVVDSLACAARHLEAGGRADVALVGLALADAPDPSDPLATVRRIRATPHPPAVVVRGDGRLEPDLSTLLDAGAAAWVSDNALVATRLPGELLRAHQAQARIDALTTERDHHRRRAEELETYARTAWHDLRNPISTLAGYARAIGMLLEDPQSLPGLELGDVSRRIVDSADQALRFADQLLAEAVDDLDTCVVQLDDVLHDVVGQLPEHDHVTVTVEASAARVVGRPGALRQTVQNLLSNALQHAGPDGTVLVRLATSHDHVELVVEDTGPGVPPEQREEVFALGTSRRHGGHGIGLHTVRRLTHALGGQVHVEDGRRLPGARFVLRLPPVRDLLLPAPVLPLR